jgi:hypothetical protein
MLRHVLIPAAVFVIVMVLITVAFIAYFKTDEPDDPEA